MNDLKTVLGLGGTILIFVAYIPYLRDIIKGKTRPHVYSWTLWAINAGLVFVLQWTGGAGAGSLVTLGAALMCVVVIILGLTRKSTIKIVKVDTLFLALSLIALGLWLIARQPVLSVTLATAADLLGLVPTVRKSWNQPDTETLSLYGLNSVRFVLALLALRTYTVVTALYPISWLLANGLFAGFLIVRRRQLLVRHRFGG